MPILWSFDQSDCCNVLRKATCISIENLEIHDILEIRETKIMRDFSKRTYKAQNFIFKTLISFLFNDKRNS